MILLKKENRLKGGDVEGEDYSIYSSGSSFCFLNLKKEVENGW